MATLIDEAKTYESQRTHNIAELESVSVLMDVKEEVSVEFPYKYIELDGKRYRVPASVLAQLRVLVEDNPAIKYFKVKKSGEGMNTEYVVIPVLKQ